MKGIYLLAIKHFYDFRDTKIKLKDIEKLENQQYETYLTNLIKDGEGVAGDILKGCQTASNIELADTSK